MKSWIGKNDTEMYSTHDEKIVAEKRIRDIKNKIRSI